MHRDFAAMAEEPIVKTLEVTGGKLRGRHVGGVAVFKGIPYGASTAGENRFITPKPPAAWSGVLEAFDWGRSAPQGSLGRGQTTNAEFMKVIASVFGGQPDKLPPGEDCLFLNVW